MQLLKSKKIVWVIVSLFAAGLFVFFFYQHGLFSNTNATSEVTPELLGKENREDYFPEKATIKYAKGFTLTYHKNYKVLNIINPFNQGRDTIKYVLVQRGTKAPTDIKNAFTIEIPIRSLACLSTSHLALTEMLGVDSMVIGFSDSNYIFNPKFKSRIKEGKVLQVGSDETLNNEGVIALKPDLLMIIGWSATKMNSYKTLMESGIGVVVNSEWMETSPLSRTEWVKMLAAFLNKEGEAEKKFNEVEKKYLVVKVLTQNRKINSKVINGMSYKGAWYIPGGRSFLAALLNDAKADSYWSKDSSTGSLPFNFEAVYEKALNADFWLDPGNARSLKEITAMDPRYGSLKPYKNGGVFNNNKRSNAAGANDYFESGVVNPDLILSDLIEIFHPDLFPNRELVYYQQLK